MVLARTPGSIDAVLFKVVTEILTWEQIFLATRREQPYFLHAANPDRRERLSVEDALALDEACQNLGKPALLWRTYTERLQPDAFRPAQDLGHGLRRTSIELGELHAVADAALADGQITASEARQIAQEADDLATEAATIRDAMNGGNGVRSVAKG